VGHYFTKDGMAGGFISRVTNQKVPASTEWGNLIDILIERDA
jgi:hypothetical protein